MYIEYDARMPVGKDGQVHGYVRWDGHWSLDGIASEIREKKLVLLAFADSDFFIDHSQAIAMCTEMRARELNVIWSACLTTAPSDQLLRSMRLAGCQSLHVQLGPDEAVEVLPLVRRYGFNFRMQNVDGTPYATDYTSYSIAEREAVAERLPGYHAAQFDLAVAYYQARRFSEVMKPLGKAMTLRFPMNDLCLNLLACLSAARHYPDQAAGLLMQAGHGCPHPVVFRNRELLKSWLESGGDLKGVRLELEPGQEAISLAYT